MNLPFFIARRYILRQKGAFSSFIIRLAILATSLSVATMVLSVAVITGFKYEIKDKLFSFWGHVQITPFTPNASSVLTPDPIKRDLKLETAVSKLAHVREITPFAVRPAIINANQYMEGILLKGMAEEYELPASVSLEGKMISYVDSAYSRDVLFSATTAARLDVSKGDEIQMYFLEPGSAFPRVRKLNVSGIFHTGMDEVDRDYAICDIRLLQRINNWAADQVNGYQVTIDDYRNSDSVSAAIFDNYIEPPLTTNTIQEIFPNIFDWLQLNEVNERVLLVIMAIVAIMNLAVALLILIVEQARMVGVLKAQGMAQGAIQQIFLYHAGLIAVAGIILGNIIALGVYYLQQQTGFLQLSEANYYVKQVPVKLFWWQPVIVNIATLVLCILCMWLPSLYIRRIQPAKVLQFK